MSRKSTNHGPKVSHPLFARLYSRFVVPWSRGGFDPRPRGARLTQPGYARPKLVRSPDRYDV